MGHYPPGLCGPKGANGESPGCQPWEIGNQIPSAPTGRTERPHGINPMNLREPRPPRWGCEDVGCGSHGCARSSLHPGLSPSAALRRNETCIMKNVPGTLFFKTRDLRTRRSVQAGGRVGNSHCAGHGTVALNISDRIVAATPW